MQSGRSDDVRKEVLEVMGCRHTYYKRRGRKHGRRGNDTRRHDMNVRMCDMRNRNRREELWNWNRSVKSHTDEVNYRAKRCEIGDRFLINCV